MRMMRSNIGCLFFSDQPFGSYSVLMKQKHILRGLIEGTVTAKIAKREGRQAKRKPTTLLLFVKSFGDRCKLQFTSVTKGLG
jgi:hypothetical protein